MSHRLLAGIVIFVLAAVGVPWVRRSPGRRASGNTIPSPRLSSAGPESATPARVEVLLSFANEVDTVVGYSVTGGTATNGTDYALADGTLTFPPGSTSKFISFPVVDDTDVEGDETVVITLGPQCLGRTQAVCGPSVIPNPPIGEHTYTILDKDVRRCSGVIATIVGSDASETIDGTNGDDVIVGLGGDDIINGLGGNDRICGRNGDDTIFGGDGADTVYGGDGNDTIRSYQGDDLSYGEDGNDKIYGSFEKDTISGGADDDELYDRGGDDTINGNSGDDKVVGGNGVDLPAGGDDDDIVRGGGDADQVNGSDGADTLVGGPGSPDKCNGGAGTDTLLNGHGCEEQSSIP